MAEGKEPKKPVRRSTKSGPGRASSRTGRLKAAPEKGGVREHPSAGRDVTDSRQSEEQLRRSQQNLKRAEAIAKIGNWEWNILTNELIWSDEVYRIYGMDQARDRPSYEVVVRTVAPECRDRFVKAVEDAVKHDAPFDGEYRMIGLDGLERFTHTIGEVVRDGAGRPVSMFGVVQDITRRKRTEEALAASEERYRFFVEHANEAVLIHKFEESGLPGPFTEANDLACAWTGFSREELRRMTPKDLDDPKHQEHIPRIIEKLRTDGHAVFETVWIRKDGGRVPVEVSTRTMQVRDRQYIVSLARDTTERKHAEEALRKRERQLAESQRIAHVGSWEHNLKTGQVFWSDELFRLLGLDPKKDPADFDLFLGMVHPDDQPALQTAIGATLKEKRPFSVKYRFVLRDGSIRTIHAQAELLPDDAGDLVILSGTGQDITDRVRAEETIRRSEQFIRRVLDTVDEGFIVIDRDYRIVTANKAYCGQAGLPCDEVIGRHCFEISHKASRPCYEEGEDCAVRHVFAIGEPRAVLHRHRDRDGQVLYVETKAFPLKDNEGRVTTAIETITNITEKFLLEEERLKTQKLESIGTLAGGIAHDFNNLLQGVFGFISMAKLPADVGEKHVAALDEAEKALHLAVKLTNQLLTFSKGGRPVKRPTDLEPVIVNAVRFALSGSRSVSNVSFAAGLHHAEADDGQISQVVQNLVLNADQAMPLGGTVTITAQNVCIPEQRALLALAPGEYVEIAVTDTGVGIPDEDLNRIFDPYFTTKEKGTGLGLATAYSIVRNHDGTIDVHSRVGKGTTFLIYLPASAAIPEPRTETTVRAEGRYGRVLLMDDEEIIRLVGARLLEALGHTAELARDGEEALAKVRAAQEAGTPFDAVILDLTVRGGMGGAEAMQLLREIDPSVKAVVSSGYSDDNISADYWERGFSAFLKKPYTIEDLGAVLNGLLAAGPAALGRG